MGAVSKAELRVSVRERLRSGVLPPLSGAAWANRGSGRPCVVCETAIRSLETEYEINGIVPNVYTHILCYTIWLEESAARGDHEL